MVCVQSSGCAPIVKAFHEGRSSAPLWENAVTFASGLRVPKAVGDFLMLDILKASKGEAVEVDDKETYEAILEFGRMEGMFLCPEGAACWAAFKELRKSGWILDSDRVVIFNSPDSIRKCKSALQTK
jgi:threonine synthase